MSLFLDTNVLVGYIFDLDPWHECALNIFSKDYKKYLSNTIKEELINKI
ncbi:MAG: hypothetical protein LBV42_04050 [Methanobrevibacter sp.]|jgi:predicted nucleic acid-binding protein|nr:hypothetical protein [Methanobrevibacter sp.]